MIQDDEVSLYILYLVQNDQVKLLCLMDYIKKLLILHQVEQEYEAAMCKIMEK